jgi:hypothetical protein
MRSRLTVAIARTPLYGNHLPIAPTGGSPPPKTRPPPANMKVISFFSLTKPSRDVRFAMRIRRVPELERWRGLWSRER